MVNKLSDAPTKGGLAQSTILSLPKYKPPRLTMRHWTTGGRVKLLLLILKFYGETLLGSLPADKAGRQADNLAAQPGLKPGYSDPKSDVLPIAPPGNVQAFKAPLKINFRAFLPFVVLKYLSRLSASSLQQKTS